MVRSTSLNSRSLQHNRNCWSEEQKTYTPGGLRLMDSVSSILFAPMPVDSRINHALCGSRWRAAYRKLFLKCQGFLTWSAHVYRHGSVFLDRLRMGEGACSPLIQ